jgi:hypothetical protein
LAPAAGLARVFLVAEKTEDRKMGAGEFTPAAAHSQAFTLPFESSNESPIPSGAPARHGLDVGRDQLPQ